MAKQTQQFTLNTEPHEAAVGPHTYVFKPEVYSDELLDAWAALRAVTIQKDEPGDDAEKIAERTKAVNAATKAFIAELMLSDEDAAALDPAPAGAAGAATFVATKLPDRVLLELQRWILGVHGLRPTGPSSDSLEPSSTGTPGDDSTGGSPSEA